MSLFTVLVPTREYELKLRQKERNIVVEYPDQDDDTDVHKTDSGSFRSEIVYKGAMVDGRHADLIIGDDFMEIKSSQSAPHVGGRKKTHFPRFSNSTNEDATIKAEIDKYFLEKHLEDTIKRYSIMHATWSRSIDGTKSYVSFPVSLKSSDLIINRLQSVGIGLKYESSVTVCSAGVYFGPHKDVDTEKEVRMMKDSPVANTGFVSDFVKSIKSRLTVAQVVSQIQSNAVLTFDFLLLVIVAAFIASLGLCENSSIILVSSMLISPLMGPIMAFTFGTVIRSCDLVKIGIRSELIGLSICLIVGFIMGICIQLNLFRGPWADTVEWPTGQMVTRGTTRGMVVGLSMAIPSGIGVALSILAGNAGSLVGAAIAASLLPPAVNCGMLLGHGFVTWIRQGIRTSHWDISCYHWRGKNTSTDDEFFKNHKQIYCPNVMFEYLYMGIVSFGLTVANIGIIFTVAVLILKIKEVAPYTTRKSLRRFWKEDLAYTRKYLVKHHGEDINSGIMDDIKKAENLDDVRLSLDNDYTLRQINRRMAGGGNGDSSILNDYTKGINKYTGQEMNHSSRKKSKEHQRSKAVAEKRKKGWFGWLTGGGRVAPSHRERSSSSPP